MGPAEVGVHCRSWNLVFHGNKPLLPVACFCTFLLPKPVSGVLGSVPACPCCWQQAVLTKRAGPGCFLPQPPLEFHPGMEAERGRIASDSSPQQAERQNLKQISPEMSSLFLTGALVPMSSMTTSAFLSPHPCHCCCQREARGRERGPQREVG